MTINYKLASAGTTYRPTTKLSETEVLTFDGDPSTIAPTATAVGEVALNTAPSGFYYVSSAGIVYVKVGGEWIEAIDVPYIQILDVTDPTATPDAAIAITRDADSGATGVATDLATLRIRVAFDRKNSGNLISGAMPTINGVAIDLSDIETADPFAKTMVFEVDINLTDADADTDIIEIANGPSIINFTYIEAVAPEITNLTFGTVPGDFPVLPWSMTGEQQTHLRGGQSFRLDFTTDMDCDRIRFTNASGICVGEEVAIAAPATGDQTVTTTLVLPDDLVGDQTATIEVRSSLGAWSDPVITTGAAPTLAIDTTVIPPVIPVVTYADGNWFSTVGETATIQLTAPAGYAIDIADLNDPIYTVTNLVDANSGGQVASADVECANVGSFDVYGLVAAARTEIRYIANGNLVYVDVDLEGSTATPSVRVGGVGLSTIRFGEDRDYIFPTTAPLVSDPGITVDRGSISAGVVDRPENTNVAATITHDDPGEFGTIVFGAANQIISGSGIVGTMGDTTNRVALRGFIPVTMNMGSGVRSGNIVAADGRQINAASVDNMTCEWRLGQVVRNLTVVTAGVKPRVGEVLVSVGAGGALSYDILDPDITAGDTAVTFEQT